MMRKGKQQKIPVSSCAGFTRDRNHSETSAINEHYNAVSITAL